MNNVLWRTDKIALLVFLYDLQRVGRLLNATLPGFSLTPCIKYVYSRVKDNASGILGVSRILKYFASVITREIRRSKTLHSKSNWVLRGNRSSATIIGQVKKADINEWGGRSITIYHGVDTYNRSTMYS